MLYEHVIYTNKSKQDNTHFVPRWPTFKITNVCCFRTLIICRIERATVGESVLIIQVSDVIISANLLDKELLSWFVGRDYNFY